MSPWRSCASGLWSYCVASLGCTHLNDALHALAEAPVLAGMAVDLG